MTVTLQLELQGAELLRKEAADLGLSVEQLASDIIRRHVAARAAGSTPDDETFRRVMAASMAENDELLRRLAK